MSDASDALSGLRENAAFLRRLARAVCSDEHLAEDAVQETQRAVLEHPPRRAFGLRPWLGALLRNAVRRELRGRARREAREARAARVEALPSAASLAEREELLRTVLERVLGLSEPYREVVLLRFYEDLPPRRIAARLGLPVETVRTRLKRALARLRSDLGGERSLPALAFLAWGSPAREGALLSPTILAMATSTRILVGAAALALFGAVGWRLAQPAQDTTSEPAAAAQPVSFARSALPPSASGEVGAERDPAPQPPPEWIVAGRVVDETGAGVAGAQVHLVAERDPFEPADQAPQVGWNQFRGRSSSTDAAGRFRGQLASVEPVLVVLSGDPGYVPNEDGGRWVTPPQLGLELGVVRRPTATLDVRVARASDGTDLDEFIVAASWPGGPYHQQRALDGRARFVLPVQGGGPIEPRVRLLEPAVEPPLERELRLSAGETRELVLVIAPAEVVSGFVVDPEGAPIEGALVVLGDETTGRGDEPFRPMREEVVVGGVRTRADGWYRLEGSGQRVTAWHPDHSPATVQRQAAERIELTPRASLRVRLLDPSGAPRAGVAVRLDDLKRGAEVTTDPGGRLSFERLEAGVHALWEGRTLLAAVRLESGEQAELDLPIPALERVELDLRFAGAPAGVDSLNGVVVGEGRVFGVHELEWSRGQDSAGGRPTIDGPLREGAYLVITREGFVSRLEIDAPSALLELEAKRLLVSAAPGTRLQVVPASADFFLRLLAARAPAVVPASGELFFHVSPGDWLVVGESGVQQARVEVPFEGARIALDR